ncbi:MAG: ATP-binding protein [Promethearchaeota archaeon]|jgi:NAD-dependent dihydropyrimidine dehydrogenase PreA subunit
MKQKNDGLYRELQKHLNKMPVGFPPTDSGIEIKLLKHLFTPEQVEIALQLKFIGEPVKSIFRRLKKKDFISSKEDLENRLDDMYFKGLIYRVTKKNINTNFYASAPFVIGMYEFQLNSLTAEFYKDSEKYLNEVYVREEYNKSGIPQLRVVPLNHTVENENLVYNYDDIEQIIENIGEPIAVMDCICRKGTDLIGHPCEKTNLRETCLTFRRGAVSFIEKGLAREITKEEALKLVADAKKDGLILQPGNSVSPMSMCICCGCCCGVLVAQKELPGLSRFFATNFYAEADPDLCEGCGICEERCNLGAARVVNNIAQVDREKCIGCGVCVPNCSSGAMKLLKKEVETIPPKDTLTTYTTIMKRKAEMARAENEHIEQIC